MRRFVRIVRGSDHIFAGNEFLQSKVAAVNPAVTMIPTSLDLGKYKIATPKLSKHIDLVWIGSSSTRKYLEDIVPTLAFAASELPALRLKIVADFDLPQAGIETLALRWSAINEAEDLASAHIGIAPMPENDWTRGKCALKVLQYMAAGLPVISSRAGVNSHTVIHGKTGYIADTKSDWVEAITCLAREPKVAAAMGEAGRENLGDYTLPVVFDRMRNVLDAL